MAGNVEKHDKIHRKTSRKQEPPRFVLATSLCERYWSSQPHNL